MQKEPFIFDSHALLKFFRKEKGHEKVTHLLEEIRKIGGTKYINAMNLGEIIYSTKREFGDQKKLICPKIWLTGNVWIMVKNILFLRFSLFSLHLMELYWRTWLSAL